MAEENLVDRAVPTKQIVCRGCRRVVHVPAEVSPVDPSRCRVCTPGPQPAVKIVAAATGQTIVVARGRPAHQPMTKVDWENAAFGKLAPPPAQRTEESGEE